MRVVAAADKFRGTATAAEVVAAIGRACSELGVDCDELPMSDGGEGLIAVLGGANRTSTVTGPLGNPVDAAWRLHRGTAVIEMATASGLALVGEPTDNRPLDATTAGTGELINLAVASGAKRIIVGLGGSATTDGGLGAIEAIANPTRLRGVELLVAHDVCIPFTAAAQIFGPQKGARPAEVRMLTRRLEGLARRYRDQFGVDVSELVGAGAAGGLAGGLAAIGGQLRGGFDLVADELDLYDAIVDADLVITGEGHLDAPSFAGKVVGGMVNLANEAGVPVAAIVGQADVEVADRIPIMSLRALYGTEFAFRETQDAIQRATLELLRAQSWDRL